MIADRYVLKNFTRVLVICFLSLAGILIVFDAVGSFDDFVEEGQKRGAVTRLMMEFYLPKLLAFFDQTSGVLAMAAGIFTITWLQRTNEMTAIRAAGIPQVRIVRPLVIAAAVVSLLAVVNRETMLPKFREQLTRKVQDWSGEKAQKLRPRYDRNTDILIAGRHTYAVDQRIEAPNFRLHKTLDGFGRRIVGRVAYYQQANSQRPAGYLIKDVAQPLELEQIPSFRRDNETLVYSPSDTPWLGEDECFVASDITFAQLSTSNSWRTYASSLQLINGLRNRSLDYGADVKVTVHSRIVQPLLDIVLFFLGLPIVLTRKPRSMFMAAGICIGMVMGFFVLVIACHGLGNSGYLLSPSLAAWSPLLILGPIAYTVCRPLWR